jgi:hypothetical protein
MKVNAVVVAAIRRNLRAHREGEFRRTSATVLAEVAIRPELMLTSLQYFPVIAPSNLERSGWFRNW